MYDNNHIQAMKRSSLWFALNAYPEKFNLPFGAIHYEMDRQLEKNNAGIIVFLIFRKAAKTMVMRANACKDLLWGKSKHTAWIGTNEGQANISARFISEMARRESLRPLFGDPRAKSAKWSEKEYFHLKNSIKFGKYSHSYDGYLTSFGANQPLQGANIAGHRPDKIILDDLEPPDKDWTDDMVEETIQWFDNTVYYAVDDIRTSKIYVIGTNARANGFVGKISKRRDVYTMKYPAMAYTQELADKFGVGLDESLWPEQWPTDMLKDLRTWQPGFGSQMLMLENSDGASRFPMDKMKWVDDLDTLPENSSDLKICITADMAYKKTKDADKSGVVVGLWDRGHILYVLEAEQGKWGSVGTIEKMLEKVVYWSTIFKGVDFKLGIEAQDWAVMEKEVRGQMRDYGSQFDEVRISLEELKSKITAKTDRVKAMIPLVEAGRVFIYKSMSQALITRLYAFRGKAVRKGDDLEDAFAYQRELGMTMNMSPYDHPASSGPVPWWKSKGMYPVVGGRTPSRRMGGLYI